MSSHGLGELLSFQDNLSLGTGETVKAKSEILTQPSVPLITELVGIAGIFPLLSVLFFAQEN